MATCIDFPCCGHTDGLPCDWTPPDYTRTPHGLCDHENGDCQVDYDPDIDDDDADWGTTPAGDQCPWCQRSEFEPSDSDDAEQTLCRGHLAEYEGTSLDGLDAMYAARED